MSDLRAMNGQRVTFSTLGMMAAVAIVAVSIMVWLQRSIDDTVTRHGAQPRHAGAAALQDVQRLDARMDRVERNIEQVTGDVREMRGELRQAIATTPRRAR